MNNSNDKPNAAKGFILKLYLKSRKNKRVSIILFSTASSFLTMTITQQLINSWIETVTLMVSIFFLTLWYQFSRSQYKNINQQAVIEHINCNFPEFEESSQLLLKQKTGSILQQLQTQKIEKLLSNESVKEQLEDSIEGVFYKPASIVFILALSIIFVASFWSDLNDADNEIEKKLVQPSNQKIQIEPIITHVEITIIPPQYTELLTSTTSSMDLEIVEGSTVSWKLNFSSKKFQYFMVDSAEEKIPFISTVGEDFLFSSTFNKTSLYRIVYEDEGKFRMVGDIYTIEVKQDGLPVIKILTPKQSLVEIPKTSAANFVLSAKVRDDYGISDVLILASVASGSGESVKFRDEEFTFDNTLVEGSAKIYNRHWELTDLKMEPGDEIYFKIQVKDNKKPVPQLVKSSSVIVRWLDEEESEATAEGVRISFIPEYFRSQRQIIIETEQLISDIKDLTLDEFGEISTDLGHSQSDLKTKYGQYLGDEIGEGPAEQFGLADGTHIDHKGDVNHSTIEVDDGDEPENDYKQPEAGHLHEDMVDENDLSGGSELIARFAHNHGGTEIGPISKQDPKSWMKMAVKEMWQAELHLMLSQPELALKYENKAYDYLKLATQAERIYVKRLGFEPPPVNEDRRLTGELEDILSYSVVKEDRPDEKLDRVLLQRAYSILSKNKVEQLNQQQQSILSQLKNRILVLSETRPALIKQAAVIERILMENSILIENCNNCITHLKQKLWQLMPAPLSMPKLRHTFLKPATTENEYLQRILLLKNSQLTRGINND